MNDLNEFFILNFSNYLYTYLLIYESNDFIQIENSRYSEIKFIIYKISLNEIEL